MMDVSMRKFPTVHCPDFSTYTVFFMYLPKPFKMLTTQQGNRYYYLKEKCKSAWIDFATAILEIRERKLYLVEYSTFEVFCSEELHIARNTAKYLMAGAKIIENLSMATNGGHLPNSERQARPLAKLEPEVQRQTWAEIIEENEPEKITAKIIAEKVDTKKEFNEVVKEVKRDNQPNTIFVSTPLTETEILKRAKEINKKKKEDKIILLQERKKEYKERIDSKKENSFNIDIFTTKKRFRIIYADPAWSYNDKQDTNILGGASKHYNTMSTSEICKLPISNITKENAVLFLWVTSPILEEAFRVIKDWGFKYKTSFVWDKIKHNMGHYNSVRHEFLLICTKGSCTPDVKKLFDSVQSIEKTKKHSEKPEQFLNIIDTLYIHGERLELFARDKKANDWFVWGNEV